MRLLTALLLSMVSLFADTSDRLPNTRKMPPVRAPKHAAPGPAGRAKTAKTGAVARAFKRGGPAPAGKTRAKTIKAPRLK
jgi:hypothetical protein